MKDAKYDKETKQGFKILATYRKDGRIHVIVKRAHDYVIGFGYNALEGQWAQGRYDFSTFEKAEKALFEEKGKCTRIDDSIQIKDYDERLLAQLKKVAEEGEKLRPEYEKFQKMYYNVGNYYSWQKLKTEDPKKYELLQRQKEYWEKKTDELAKKWDSIIDILNRSGDDFGWGHFDKMFQVPTSRLPIMQVYNVVLKKIENLTKSHGKSPYPKNDSMKQYKIDNHIITADSPTKALEIHKMLTKDSDALRRLVDEYLAAGRMFERANYAGSRKYMGENDNQDYYKLMQIAVKVREQLKKELQSMDAAKVKERPQKGWSKPDPIIEKLNDANSMLYWGTEQVSGTLRTKGKEIANDIDVLQKRYANYYNLRDSIKDSVEGVYQCKNDEVIEVRYDDRRGKYLVSFQKGGSPELLDESNVKKLLASYRAYKFQDSVFDEDVDQLSAEEQKAIDDYKKAISGTSDPKLLNLFSHILKEEIEHLEELQNAKEGEFEDCDSVGDSIKDGATGFTTWCKANENPENKLKKDFGNKYKEFFYRGCKTNNKTFTSLNDANSYALNLAEKWENAGAVKYITQKDNEIIGWGERVSEPKGTEIWLICGWLPE